MAQPKPGQSGEEIEWKSDMYPGTVVSATLELRHAAGLSSSVIGAVQTDPNDPDRVYYAVASTVVVASLADPSKNAFLRGHDGDIAALAVSPSGRYLASGQGVGTNADVVVWDLSTMTELHRLSEHDEGVACLAFSPDDRVLVSGGVAADGKIFCWDARTGGIIANGALAPEECRAVTFSSAIYEGTYYTFATAGVEACVVWGVDAKRGLLGGQKCGTGFQRRVYVSVEFSPDATMLYAGSTSGDVTEFTVNGCVLRNVAVCCKSNAACVLSLEYLGLAKDAYLIGGGDGTVSVYYPKRPPTPMDTMEPLATLKGAVTSIAKIAASNQVVVATAEGNKYVVSLQTLRPGAAKSVCYEESHIAPVTSVLFAPTDCFGGQERLVSGSADGWLRAWSISAEGMAMGTLRAQERMRGGLNCVAAVPGTILTGWGNGHVCGFRDGDGALLWTLPDAHVDGVTCIAVSNERQFFVTGGAGGDVRVWDVASRQLVSTLKEHNARVVGLAVLAGDAHVVSASRDRSILTWDLIRERRTTQHLQRVGGINASVVKPQGSSYADASAEPDGASVPMVTVGQDRSLTFWDLSEQQPLQIVPGTHARECTCVALSSEGVLATGSKDQMLKLWDFESGRLLASKHAHCKSVLSLSFSADGRTLVSGGEDGVIMTWAIDVKKVD